MFIEKMIKGITQKNRSKRGMFNASTKTAYQSKFKQLEKERIEKKKEEGKKLTPREERFIRPTTITRTKFQPKQGFGRPNPKSESALELGSITDLGKIDVAISSRQRLALNSLLPSKNNVYSMHDINKLLNNFVSVLRQVPGVTSVKVEGTRQNPKIKIVKDYQETVMDFNPKNVTLLAKEWKLKLPDNLIKIDETHYKAPEQQFRSYHYYHRSSGGSSSSDDQYSSYSPLYIELYDPNRLKLIKRFGVFEYYDKRIDNDSGSYTHEEKSKSFLSSLREFYKTGILKRIEDYGTFLNYEHEKDTDSYNTNTRTHDVYLTKAIDINKRGNITKQTTYKTYENKDRYQRYSDGDTITDEYYKPYKNKEIIYDDNAQFKFVQEWTPYRIKYTDYRNDDGERDTEITKDIYLKRRQEYEQGKLQQEQTYDSYMNYIYAHWGPSFWSGYRDYKTYLQEQKRYNDGKLEEYRKNKPYEYVSYENNQSNGYSTAWTSYSIMPDIIIKKQSGENNPNYSVERYSTAITKYFNDRRRRIEERRTRVLERKEGKIISKPSSYYYFNPQHFGTIEKEQRPYLAQKAIYNPLQNEFKNIQLFASPYKLKYNINTIPELVNLEEKPKQKPKKQIWYGAGLLGNYQTYQPNILEQEYQNLTSQSTMYRRTL